MKSPSLAALFPDEPYGFRLTLKRGDVREFFAASSNAPTVLAERRRWLDERSVDFLVDDPSNRPGWQAAAAAAGLELDSAAAFGRAVEPDVVLLRRDPPGTFRVRGGAVVFPTSWSLPEKEGLTLAETHGVVPGLNAAIGPAIDRFLDRLKPDLGAVRANWGLAASGELNLHPALARPRLQADTESAQVWLRVEHQILVALPAAEAVLFGIRIALHPLADVVADAAAKSGLHRALASMPAAMADYKGLSAILPRFLDWTR